MKNNILDYLDFKRFNTLLEGFNKSTGFVTAILDLEGNVLSQSGWRTICTKFHRINPETKSNCLISDTVLANMSSHNDFNIYKCHNGLYDVAVPLIIDGFHVANIFTGQFFMEPPNTHFFEEQAKKYGFELDEYIKVLKDVPIVAEEEVKNVVNFLLHITHMIIDLTRDKIEQENLKTLLESSLESPKDIIILSLDKNYRYLYFNSTHKDSMLQSYNTLIKVGDCIFDYMTSKEDIKKIKLNYDIALSGTSHTTVEKYGDIEENYYETRFNPIYNKIGEIIGLTVFAENITKLTLANKKQRESEKKYSLLNDMMPLGMVHYQVVFNEKDKKYEYIFLEVNNTFEMQVGMKKIELVGRNLIDVFPKTEKYWLDNFDEVVSSGNPIIFDDFSATVNGHMKLSLYLIKSDVLAVVIEDITNMMKEKEIAQKYLDDLLLTRNMFENSIENAPLPIMIHAEDGTVLNISKTWTKLTKYKKSDISTIFEWTEKAYGQKKEEVLDFIRKLYHLSTVQHDGEFEVTTKDGKKLTWDFNSGYVGTLPDGRAVAMSVATDVTDRLSREKEIRYMSYHDSLTGLYNRRYYEESLIELDVPENYPLTIIMSDINGLKLINDAFGHGAGDKLLIEASKAISGACREKDLVARIGGDEFVIVMPLTTGDEAEKIINEINEKAKTIMVESIVLSISFGFETKNNADKDIHEIFRSAEDLMYREKLIEIPSMRSGAIETILNTLYEKDKNSEIHSRTVSGISEKLATAYGMNRQEVSEVKTAGLLHDIGKIIIPISIITKDGKLTSEEYDLIKGHPEIGFRILNSTHDMRNISNIVLSHHERWDGLGYPRGIKAEDVPVQSRIIAIADAFDAMTSVRSYRDIFTNDQALNEIIDNAGTQFDPELVKIFKEHFNEIINL